MGRLGECQGTRSAVAKRVKKSGPGRGANGGERADGMLPKKKWWVLPWVLWDISTGNGGFIWFYGKIMGIYGITLWLFNIAMEAMAHRNRWLTY